MAINKIEKCLLSIKNEKELDEAINTPIGNCFSYPTNRVSFVKKFIEDKTIIYIKFLKEGCIRIKTKYVGKQNCSKKDFKIEIILQIINKKHIHMCEFHKMSNIRGNGDYGRFKNEKI